MTKDYPGMMAGDDFDPNALDIGIRETVLLLRKAGFETFMSCEGGKGHSFRHETIGLRLRGDYFKFRDRLAKFLRSQGMQWFQVCLMTDYHPSFPGGRNYVYLEGIDLLSKEKKRRVLESSARRERKATQQLREMGFDVPTRRKSKRVPG
jgi:hypothetical protein